MRPGAPGRRDNIVRSPPRSPPYQDRSPSRHGQDQPTFPQLILHSPPRRSLSPTRTYSTQIEGAAACEGRGRFCRPSADTEPTDCSEEDGNLNMYHSPVFLLCARLQGWENNKETGDDTNRVAGELGGTSPPICSSYGGGRTNRPPLPFEFALLMQSTALKLKNLPYHQWSCFPVHYRDLRRGLWQPTRFVPVVNGISIVCDVAISMQLELSELVRKVADEFDSRTSPSIHLPEHIWVIFQSHEDMVPGLVRAKGGVRPDPSSVA